MTCISFTGVIVDYFKYVSNLKFDEKPDYNCVRKSFNEALRSIGKTDEGSLIFESKKYEFELELDISSDTDVSINITRTLTESCITDN